VDLAIEAVGDCAWGMFGCSPVLSCRRALMAADGG